MNELQARANEVGSFRLLLLACPHDPAVFQPLVAHVREILGQQVPLVLGASKRQFRMMSALYGDESSTVAHAPSSFEDTYRLLEAALVRRKEPIPARVLEWRGYRVLLDQDKAEFAGTPIRLRPRELDLAVAFFRNVDRVLTREWLFANVWGRKVENGALSNAWGRKQENGSLSRALDVCVSGLRTKLGLRFRLQAIWGQGYQLSDEPWSLDDQRPLGFFGRAGCERGGIAEAIRPEKKSLPVPHGGGPDE
ncbi:helix-turn-helix domain-containing protein [Variovorax paradoxus]|uniref:helix-turn-helix domain-containing protein n=1 Tax=Variovorax paradoxus TaxID=34073 RepID=UPI00248000B7|nr:helix-turn-helix domain-containing protein [Variovorax paradoxus]WGT61327.1 helix-turn-helix domain-containing protein [Variovorax paradoxus]